MKLRQFDADVQKLNAELDIIRIMQFIKKTKHTINSIMKCIINLQESIVTNLDDNEAQQDNAESVKVNPEATIGENLNKDEWEKSYFEFEKKTRKVDISTLTPDLPISFVDAEASVTPLISSIN